MKLIKFFSISSTGYYESKEFAIKELKGVISVGKDVIFKDILAPAFEIRYEIDHDSFSVRLVTTSSSPKLRTMKGEGFHLHFTSFIFLIHVF